MKPPFTISICSIAVRQLPLFEALDRIAESGFKAVEILYPQLEKLDDADLHRGAEQCARLGLTPTVIAPYFSFTRGKEWWTNSLKTAEQVLRAASVFHVKKIRTFIDIGPDGLPSERADESHWQAARDGLRELCSMDPTTEFVIETHDNTLADTLPTTQRVFEEVDRPNLRLNFQGTSDFLKRGYMESLETLYPLVSHMHWDQIGADGAVTYIEEPGLMDFPKLIDWLTARNYRGTASVEYCWQPVDPKRIDTAWQYLSRIAG